jgi:hypothetical protein
VPPYMPPFPPLQQPVPPQYGWGHPGGPNTWGPGWGGIPPGPYPASYPVYGQIPLGGILPLPGGHSSGVGGQSGPQQVPGGRASPPRSTQPST